MQKIGPGQNNFLVISRLETKRLYQSTTQQTASAYSASNLITGLKPSTYYEFTSDREAEITAKIDGVVVGRKLLRNDLSNGLMIYTRNSTEVLLEAVDGIPVTIASTERERPHDNVLILDSGVKNTFSEATTYIANQDDTAVVQSTSVLEFDIEDLEEQLLLIQVYPSFCDPITAEYYISINGSAEIVAGFNSRILYNHQGGDLNISLISSIGTLFIQRVVITRQVEFRNSCSSWNTLMANTVYTDGICNVPINVYSLCVKYEVYDRTSGEMLGNLWSNGYDDSLLSASNACVLWNKLPGTQKIPLAGSFFGPNVLTSSTVDVSSAYGYGTKIGVLPSQTTGGNQKLQIYTKSNQEDDVNVCIDGWCVYYDGDPNDLRNDPYLRTPTYYILASRSTGLYFNHMERAGFDPEICGCNQAKHLIIDPFGLKININDIHDSFGSYISGSSSNAAVMSTAKWISIKVDDEECYAEGDVGTGGSSGTSGGTSGPVQTFTINGEPRVGFRSQGTIRSTTPCEASATLVPVSVTGLLSIYDLVFSNVTSGFVKLSFINGQEVTINYEDTEEEIIQEITSAIGSNECDVVRYGNVTRISISTAVAQNPIILSEVSVDCDSSLVVPPIGPFIIDLSKKGDIVPPVSPPTIDCPSCPSSKEILNTLTHDVLRHEEITGEMILNRYGYEGGVIYTPTEGGIDVVYPLDKLAKNTQYIIAKSDKSLTDVLSAYRSSTFIYSS